MSALVNTLIQNFTNERISNYFTYVSKFTKTEYVDYSIILVKELLLAVDSVEEAEISKQQLIEHESFKKWANDNIEIFS